MRLGSARIGAGSGSGFSRQLAGAAATLARAIATLAPRDNPNEIPLPPKSNRAPKEAGELMDQDQEGDPSWLCEPAVPTYQFYNKKGESIPHPEGWN